MNSLKSRRARLAAFSVGLAATAAPFLAQPASAAEQSCKFVLERVTAVDVQERRGDEIIIKLDGRRLPTSGNVPFRRDGVVQNHPSFQSPTFVYTDDNPLSVQLIEVDPLFNDQIDRTKTLECTGAQANQTLVFVEPGVKYLMSYHVNRL